MVAKPLKNNFVQIETAEVGPETDRSSASSMDNFGSPLFLEQPRTADERIAPDVKPQQTVSLARNSDTDALPDFARLVIVASEPSLVMPSASARISTLPIR
jgi:hypothetical protein